MKKCPFCAEEIQDEAIVCKHCGRDLQPQSKAAPRDIGQDAGMRMLLPVGRSGFAIAAGYAGLFALLVFPAPIALFLGILAVIDIKRNPKKHGMGRAVFALITGGLGSAPPALGLSQVRESQWLLSAPLIESQAAKM